MRWLVCCYRWNAQINKCEIIFSLRKTFQNSIFAAIFLNMDLLAQRLSKLTESETLQMAKLSRELKAKGIDIIDLSLGEPDFDTPQHIKDAAKKAIDDGYTKYTPVSGYLDLRVAISEKFKRENNLEFSAEQIVVSTGAKQSLMNTMFSLLNAGDEVIVPSPYWVSYREMVKLADGITVEIKSDVESNFKITAAQLEAAITPKTKLFCFSSPCNPTGTVYTRDELKSFADVLEKYPDIIIVSDEIYEHINFLSAHESIAQFENMKNRVVIVNGVSKAYAMTGWRIGYSASPIAVAKASDKIQGQITSGPSSISQRASLAALTGTQEPTTKMRDAYLQRRNLVASLLNEISGLKINKPDGAFYFFPEVSFFFGKKFNRTEIKNADDLCMYLIHEGRVSIVTGKAFGNGNCVRISYATSEEKLREGMKRMKEALQKLQ